MMRPVRRSAWLPWTEPTIFWQKTRRTSAMSQRCWRLFSGGMGRRAGLRRPRGEHTIGRTHELGRNDAAGDGVVDVDGGGRLEYRRREVGARTNARTGCVGRGRV